MSRSQLRNIFSQQLKKLHLLEKEESYNIMKTLDCEISEETLIQVEAGFYWVIVGSCRNQKLQILQKYAEYEMYVTQFLGKNVI